MRFAGRWFFCLLPVCTRIVVCSKITFFCSLSQITFSFAVRYYAFGACSARVWATASNFWLYISRFLPTQRVGLAESFLHLLAEKGKVGLFVNYCHSSRARACVHRSLCKLLSAFSGHALRMCKYANEGCLERTMGAQAHGGEVSRLCVLHGLRALRRQSLKRRVLHEISKSCGEAKSGDFAPHRSLKADSSLHKLRCIRMRAQESAFLRHF